MNKQVTRKELEQIAENWYQRTTKLRQLWQDESQPYTRRAKAYGLFCVMAVRVIKCAHALSKVKSLKKFPAGGLLWSPEDTARQADE